MRGWWLLVVAGAPLLAPAPGRAQAGSPAGGADPPAALTQPGLHWPAPAFLSVPPAVSANSVLPATMGRLPLTLPPADTPRTRLIEYSDAYYTRLTIHRVGSYTILPLFAGEYLMGQKLFTATNVPTWVKPAHRVVAGAIGTVFAVNTVTGVWNLWEGRKDPNDRTRRYLHAGLMLASDAGFFYTSTQARAARFSDSGARRHRNYAIGSMSLSVASTLIMWLRKD